MSFLCLRTASIAITVRARSVSGCQTCSVGRAFLPSQGGHPASRELKPRVPVEAFLSWGHLDVDGFLEQQLPGVPGHVNHCGLLPVCRKYDMKVIFKSGRSLRSVLTKVKDPLPMEKKAKVVYRIPCSCGKSYIGETKRRLETRLREHQEACRKGTLEKSAVAEHAWNDHHTIKWEETAVVDMARHPRELLLKEAIHIQMTPAEERLNRDAGLELPGCWVAALRRQEGTTNRAGLTPTDRSRANSDCN